MLSQGTEGEFQCLSVLFACNCGPHLRLAAQFICDLCLQALALIELIIELLSSLVPVPCLQASATDYWGNVCANILL